MTYVAIEAGRILGFGCAAVIVDAKPGASKNYGKFGLACFERLEGQSDARPQPTAMYSPIREIRAAAGPDS